MNPARRLNIASGNHPSGAWGWDVDLHFAADVQANVSTLPFPDATFTAAYMGHFLEHVPWEVMPSLLAEVRRVLVPGAVVAAVGPCIHLAIQTGQPPWLIDAILSDPRTVNIQPGVHHAWTPTEELTVAAMEWGGFTSVRAVPIAAVDRPEWPNPTTAPWQCAVLASCP